MRVAIVGGGVIGLSCAWWLRDGGAEVTVIERGRCGDGASRGNTGWITPGLAAPLAAPGATAQALRWMLRPDGPFRLHPRADPRLAAWLWRFWRAGAPDRYRAGVEAMAALNRRTLACYDALRDAGVAFEMHRGGLLCLARDERSLDAEAEVIAQQAAIGVHTEHERLDGDAVRRLEPAVGDRVVAGLHLPRERYVRPESLIAGLATALRERGVRIVEGVPVERLDRDGAGTWRVGGFDADRVVVAGGAWTRELLSAIGVAIPLQPAKGYSVTATGSGTRPRHALYLTEAKVAVSPYDGGVRVAGMLELGRHDLAVDRRRLGAVVRAARGYLGDWRPERPQLEWAGLRPLSADGLPIVGRVPGRDGLFVATGHSTEGITMGPATGAALAPLVVHGERVPALEPFGLERFGS